MKKFSYSLLLAVLISSSLQAQSQEQMMQQMQQMQNCMMQIDYQELSAMEQRSNEVLAQMHSLCDSGNEKQAEKIALQFSNEVMSSNAMKTMKKCAAMVPGMAQQVEVPDFREQLQQQSLCESLKQ